MHDLEEGHPASNHGSIQCHPEIPVILLQLSTLLLVGVASIQAENLVDEGEYCVYNGDEDKGFGPITNQSSQGKES